MEMEGAGGGARVGGGAGLRVRKGMGGPSCHPSAALPGTPKFVGGGWGDCPRVWPRVATR